MDDLKRRSAFSAGGIIVLFCIVVLLNGIARYAFGALSFDLTQEKLYSLTPGSIRILHSIDEPITLQFFFSRTEASRLPALSLYAARVRDLLQEYERRSGGKLRLQVHNPRPDTAEEEWAQKFGLTPLRLPAGQIYFGLVGMNALGEERAIPVFDITRQEYLEYDVSKLIYSLLREAQVKIGLLSPLNLAGGGASAPGMPQQAAAPWVFISQLETFASLKVLDAAQPTIDDSIDMLLLVHPKNLDKQTLYEIDQFVLRGGSLVVFEDPFSVQDLSADAAGMSASDNSSSLNQLTKKWGISLDPDVVVADIGLSTKVSAGPGEPPQEFAMWLSIGSDELNQQNVATSELNNVVLPWAGALTIEEVQGIETEVLASTTKRAMLRKRQEALMSRADPQSALRGYVPGNTEIPLAAVSRGIFPTNFPEGKPGAQASSADHLMQSKGTSTLAVVADVDFISNGFAAAVRNFLGQRVVSLLNDNISLGLNLVENLSGSDDLISIRSRGNFSRPFEKVQEIERLAALRWRSEEMRLQAKLNNANQRLKVLQGSAPEGQKVFGKAVLDEIRKFRDERVQAQRRLREVRRDMRQEKEALGKALFLLNTFFVPGLLVLGSMCYGVLKSRRRRVWSKQ